jgi:membrane-associated protease RseP (regulator of RpoE activity)
MDEGISRLLWSAWQLPYSLRVLVLVFVAAWTALAVHELAHALVARALGIRVWGVTLGRGPLLWQGDLGGTRFRVALLPLHGGVSLHDDDARALGYRLSGPSDCVFHWLHGSSWRAPVISAAGSLANLLGAAGVALYWQSMPRLAAPSQALFVSCFVAHLAMYLNLAPIRGLDGWRVAVQANAWRRHQGDPS